MPAGADVSFGNQTYVAVAHYQTTRNLSPDGIVGRNTMIRLDGDILAFDVMPSYEVFGFGSRLLFPAQI